jgi:eukaryotic translation initiation factor 2C
MELCDVPAQKLPRKESPEQVAEMIKSTCTQPHERRQKIEEKVSEAHFESDSCLAAFGATINPTMLTVEGRTLDSPELIYDGGVGERPQGGVWNLRGKGFIDGREITSMAIMSLCDPRHNDEIMRFFDALIQQLGVLRMKGPRGRPPLVTRHARHASMEHLFGTAIDEAERTFGMKPQVVFCVNPTGDTFNYAELKRASDTTFGIPSQCMLLRHCAKKQPQYIANLMLKVNMKIGGKNAVFRHTLFPENIPTIIFGCDLSHPGPMDRSRPSIATCVATLDEHACRHAAAMRKQDRDANGKIVTIIQDLEGMVKELLKQFYMETNCKPMRILVYRDGIGEGDFEKVRHHEVRSIQQACASLEQSYAPQITFIVVQKRHHTRFFATTAEDTDRSGNIKAGTVIDTVVCHPTDHDFYLMSHAGLQGCSRPAHYHVLYDEICYTPDQLHALTYRLCYTFARCTRAVSVIPAVYYAHLVATRARMFLADSSDAGSSFADGNFMESTGRILDVHRALERVMYYI